LPSSNYSHSTGAASPHLSDGRSADGSPRPYAPKGWQSSDACLACPLATDSDLRALSETPISFTLMVHHIVLYKLKPEVTPARVEAMMMNTRMQLLKIPEVLNIKCGKRIDPELPWPFFIAIDFESMDKYAIFREDPIFVKFMEEVIKPNTEDSLDLDFEMDPGKDVRFS
jgi:Stress responsive A/B Barrel Domain